MLFQHRQIPYCNPRCVHCFNGNYIAIFQWNHHICFHAYENQQLVTEHLDFKTHKQPYVSESKLTDFNRRMLVHKMATITTRSTKLLKQEMM